MEVLIVSSTKEFLEDKHEETNEIEDRINKESTTCENLITDIENSEKLTVEESYWKRRIQMNS